MNQPSHADRPTTPGQGTRPAALSAAGGAALPEPSSIALRPPRPGDMGWVVSRHGALYAAEYGWDWRFEALVARIAADFIERFDDEREACWIAEATPSAKAGQRPGSASGDNPGRDSGGLSTAASSGQPTGEGLRAGCVFLVQARDETSGAVLPGVAQLRMLIVEPAARGTGLGRRLVAECEAFARRAGYHRIRLWTNSVLDAARHIYESRGYRLVASEAHESFGHPLVGEIWELDLR